MLSESYVYSLNNSLVTPAYANVCFYNDFSVYNTQLHGLSYDKHVGQYNSDISVKYPNEVHGLHDAYVKTDTSVCVEYNLPLYTVDIMNYWFQDTSDNSFNYLVFIRNNSHQVLKSFHLLNICCVTGYMTLMDCQWQPIGPLGVCSTVQLGIQSHMHQGSIRQRRLEADKAYDNFKQDCLAMEHHGMSYEGYITSLIDHIVISQNVNNECDKSDNTMDRQTIPKQNDAHSLSKCQVSTNEQISGKANTSTSGRVDINDPSKTKGYIALQSTQFDFIGPDRASEEISSVHQYLRIAKTIRDLGLPNYKRARIPIKSGLNIDAWKRHLYDYPDKKLIQYLQYRFPLLRILTF